MDVFGMFPIFMLTSMLCFDQEKTIIIIIKSMVGTESHSLNGLYSKIIIITLINIKYIFKQNESKKKFNNK